MARRKTKSRSRRRKPGTRRLPWGRALLAALLLLSTLGVGYGVYLDATVRAKFEGKRWAVPARVYARPLELYVGQALTPAGLAAELDLLAYRRSPARQPGTFQRHGDSFILATRPFAFWDGEEPSRLLEVSLHGGRVEALRDAASGASLPLARLDPMFIGGIYPAHNEDRILVRLEEVPEVLVQTLLAVEDRAFASHRGLDARGIARALWANLRAGAVVQGGSTLTQQLVKNFYLDQERTLARKAKEAAMALLLEWRYGKDEILEAYLNEVYLGQEGRRAIHGFGLASRFYFDKPLGDLELHEVALLVGLVKGPSYYDPRRHPQRALTRRNVVLDLLAEQGAVAPARVQVARQQPLGVSAQLPRGLTPYPAFMDLVRRQLRRDYRDEDLTSEGLRIFTSLDPLAQAEVQRALAARLRALEQNQRVPAGQLQAAVILTDTASGEVLGLAGGRDPGFAGFNRALDAARPIGSLVKPAVYLTALAQPARYTLVSRVDDSPITWDAHDGTTWSPANYDGQSHGQVPLYLALARSYNQATVRLGMELGVGEVVHTLNRLGVERALPAYPSSLLGAVELSPYEVTQVYQTLASGGFHMPLRAIREILTADGERVQRYALKVQQAVDPAAVQAVNSGLQAVVQVGTAQGLRHWLPAEQTAAGKTGTTNDRRDSWFAGFTGQHLAVVWLGTDDNRPTGLTGSAGALTVWGDIMARLPSRPLEPTPAADVEWVWIDPQTLLMADAECVDAVQLAFVKGTAPQSYAPCAGGKVRDALRKTADWFNRLFE